jgi:hypothetical protein
MLLREQRAGYRPIPALPTDGLAESVTRLDPRRLHGDSAADLFIAATISHAG